MRENVGETFPWVGCKLAGPLEGDLAQLLKFKACTNHGSLRLQGSESLRWAPRTSSTGSPQPPHAELDAEWRCTGGAGDPKTTLPLWVLRPAAHDNRVRVLLQTAIPGTHTEILFHVAFSGIQALITRLF